MFPDVIFIKILLVFLWQFIEHTYFEIFRCILVINTAVSASSAAGKRFKIIAIDELCNFWNFKRSWLLIFTIPNNSQECNHQFRRINSQLKYVNNINYKLVTCNISTWINKNSHFAPIPKCLHSSKFLFLLIKNISENQYLTNSLYGDHSQSDPIHR